MKQERSQGPSRAALVGSSVLVCAVLVGAAYWLRDEGSQTGRSPGPPATSKLQAIYDRCEGAIERDEIEGRPRTRCTRKSHPAFMIEVIGDERHIDKATMLVPMRGDMNQLLDRMLVGLEMFGAVAGVRADHFLPKDYTEAMGTSETRLAYEGKEYVTQPVANLGLVFSVTPVGVTSQPAN